MKVRYVVLRNIAKHSDCIDPLHREQRRRPRGRGGLDQIASVHQAARHHAVERRHDLRIGEQRLGLLHGRSGEVDLVGGQGAVRFRNAEIRLGDRRIGTRLIEPLGGNPVIIEECFLAFQRDVLKRHIRPVVVHLAARSLQRTLLGGELGLVLGKLLLHFGDVDHREHLTRFHVVADINANIGQVSGDFGEEIRLLESGEGGIGLQPLSHREAPRMHHLDRWAALHLR